MQYLDTKLPRQIVMLSFLPLVDQNEWTACIGKIHQAVESHWDVLRCAEWYRDKRRNKPNATQATRRQGTGNSCCSKPLAAPESLTNEPPSVEQSWETWWFKVVISCFWKGGKDNWKSAKDLHRGFKDERSRLNAVRLCGNGSWHILTCLGMKGNPWKSLLLINWRVQSR